MPQNSEFEDQRLVDEPDETSPNPKDVERMYKAFKTGDKEKFYKAFEMLQRKLTIDQEVRDAGTSGMAG